jgi:hypothetical protein
VLSVHVPSACTSRNNTLSRRLVVDPSNSPTLSTIEVVIADGSTGTGETVKFELPSWIPRNSDAPVNSSGPAYG